MFENNEVVEREVITVLVEKSAKFPKSKNEPLFSRDCSLIEEIVFPNSEDDELEPANVLEAESAMLLKNELREPVKARTENAVVEEAKLLNSDVELLCNA